MAKQDPIMDMRETYQHWKQAQQAAAQAEARLNQRIAEFFEGQGVLPDRKDFLEVRFLRSTSAELLEHCVAAKAGDAAVQWLQPAFPTGPTSSAAAEAPGVPRRAN
jgi:hypothetical protein